MWLELGAMILSTVLSVAGIGMPQLNADAVPSAEQLGCAARSTDACLASDACDVFVAASGVETCAIACDMRDVASCALDSNCAVVDGVCDYADAVPVGC